jgi:hypothetical protein
MAIDLDAAIEDAEAQIAELDRQREAAVTRLAELTDLRQGRERSEGRREAPGPHGIADWSGFLPPPPRTVRAVLPHTAHRRSSPPAFGSFPSPRPMWTRRDDGSVEIDQPKAVRRLEGQDRPAVAPSALVALGHVPGKAVGRVVADLVEVMG